MITLEEYKNFILNERRGVLDYYNHDDTDIDNLYFYIRNMIINKINSQNIIGNIIKFDLPTHLLNYNNKKLKQLTIFYHNNTSNIKMYINEYNKFHLCLHIYVDIFDIEFKVILFHELKHYIQLSLQPYNFKNYYLEIYKQYPQLIKSQFIKNLIEAVYKLNPQESQAFLEQAYNKAFLCAFNNESIKSTYDFIVNDFNLSNNFFNILYKKCDEYDDILVDFILTTFVINFNELVGNKHGYRLFSDNLYKESFVIKLRDTINNENDIANIIENIALKIKNNKALTNKIINAFKLKLGIYKNRFIKRISSVIYDAFNDINEYNKSQYAKLNLPIYYNFIGIENNKIYIEIIIEDIDNYKIFKLFGKNIINIIEKFNYLKHYLEEYNLDVNIGFDILNDIADNYQLNKKFNLPIYTNFKNLDNLINKLNYLI